MAFGSLVDDPDQRDVPGLRLSSVIKPVERMPPT